MKRVRLLHDGGCHCGNITLRLKLTCGPSTAPVRACQCTFCRAHGARTVTDPDGRVEIRLRDPAEVSRYRFGLETADFLVCRRCGVYVAAVAETEAGLRATVNVNALEDRDSFDRQPPGASYEGESAAERLLRRAARWTPASVE